MLEQFICITNLTLLPTHKTPNNNSLNLSPFKAELRYLVWSTKFPWKLFQLLHFILLMKPTAQVSKLVAFHQFLMLPPQPGPLPQSKLCLAC